MKSPDPKIIVAADAKKPTETVAARAFSLAESNFWLRNLKIRDYEALFARTIEDTNHPHLFNHDTKICHFLARNRFFRPGGDFQDPPPYFKGARCNKNASQEQRNAHGPVLAASLRQNVTFFVKNQPKLILG